MSWRGGYVADVAYGGSIQTRMSPGRLSACALMGGVRPPDASRPFRYLELGCGSGLNTALLAASNPHASFVGVDFNPAHVDSAQRLIADAGLENVVVHEASFAEFADRILRPEDGFDYVATHGVWTWVSREVQEDLARVFRKATRPGGLAYVSYNNMAAWGAALPLQKLLYAHAQRTPGDSLTRIRAALNFVKALKAAKTRGLNFALIDGVLSQVDWEVERLPHNLLAYLAHEYLNENWRPVFPSEVEEALAEAKLTFAASADPLSNLDGDLDLTASEQTAVNAAYPDADSRRRLGDLVGPSTFRADIFVRGANPLPPPVLDERLRALVLAPLVTRDEMKLKIATRAGSLELDPGVYVPIFDRLAQGEVTVGELAGFEAAARNDASPRELVAMLVGSGAAEVVARPGVDGGKDGRARAQRFNVAMMQSLREQAGGSLGLASVKLGAALPVSINEAVTYVARVAPDQGDPVLKDAEVQADGAAREPFWRLVGAL